MIEDKRPAPAPTRPSTAAAWWTLAILFVAYTLSFIDRTIISLLVEPMKRDLQITDTQISLLQGLAFSLVYTLGGYPIAILADRFSRRKIIATGIAVWSVMTGVCGFASSYWHLFLARMGVGIGEASLGPAAYSLIADIFPEHQRARAMAVYGASAKVGAGLAMLIGGALVGFAADAESVATWFGEVRSWHLVFLVVGFPGVLVAVLALTIAEPRRATPQASVPSGQRIRPFLANHRTTLTCLFLGLSICALIAVAVMSWAPTFFIRVHGYSAGAIGKQLGTILLFAGLFGAYGGGACADYWAKRGVTDATIRTALLGLTLATVFGTAAMLVASASLSLVLTGVCAFFGAFSNPAGAAAVQALAPPYLRARLAALYLLVVGLISSMIGPTSVALATDYLFGDPKSIGYALALVIGGGGIIGMALLGYGMRPFRESVGRLP